MELVRDKQPIRFSGYTCQEYALDLAFQISCARTYTHAKSAFICTLVLCCLLFSSVFMPVIIIVPVNTDVFNPFTVISIFMALVSNRFGYTNVVKQKRHWFQELQNHIRYKYLQGMCTADYLKLLVTAVYLSILYLCANNVSAPLLVVVICIIATLM